MDHGNDMELSHRPKATGRAGDADADAQEYGGSKGATQQGREIRTSPQTLDVCKTSIHWKTTMAQTDTTS